jgi:hypothetical protein
VWFHAAVRPPETRTVVLVEGASDRVALETLARRRGRQLDAEGVAVVSMDGATNIGTFLERFGAGAGARVAGLCDAREASYFCRSLERAGLGTDLTRDDMERLGFYVCVADLEDELIRALGTDLVLRIVEAARELGAFRTLQRQPAQQARTLEQQLRRFIGTRGGRKIRYAELLVDALPPTRVPRPLDELLAHV